jgi:hypothetical protein
VKLPREHERRHPGTVRFELKEPTYVTSGEQRIVFRVLDVRKMVENLSSTSPEVMLGPFLCRFDDMRFIVAGLLSP